MTDLAREYYKRHHAGETGMRRYGFTVYPEDRGRWFKGRIPGGGVRILDIGCRDGTFTSQLLAGNEVVGVDIDDEALRLAREAHGFETHLVNLNVERLRFEPASFDVVIAGEVLEHLQFPGQVVEDIAAVLRPGGLFLGSVPNAFRLRNRLEFLLGREIEHDPTHLHQFSPRAMRKLLAPFGAVELDYLRGRYRRLHPELMGGDMVWAARR